MTLLIIPVDCVRVVCATNCGFAFAADGVKKCLGMDAWNASLITVVFNILFSDLICE